MSCHKRCTYFFIVLFSFLAWAGICVQIITPAMLKEKGKSDGRCFGLVFDCKTCPTVKTLDTITKCQRTFQETAYKNNAFFMASFITACVAGIIVAVMTILSIILGCGICCSYSKWPKFISRFIIAYIVLLLIAFCTNIASMALWSQLTEPNYEYHPSYYVGWAASGLMFIVFLMLVFVKCCEKRDSDEIGDSSASRLDQPLYRSLYQMTATTVFKGKMARS